ncbi:MAG: hypothetical protein HRT88_11500 [Lentisphaeraceae bacterium]|nr:hypothetical protein [Lentisphaeraceae bacterium]
MKKIILLLLLLILTGCSNFGWSPANGLTSEGDFTGLKYGLKVRPVTGARLKITN